MSATAAVDEEVKEINTLEKQNSDEPQGTTTSNKRRGYTKSEVVGIESKLGGGSLFYIGEDFEKLINHLILSEIIQAYFKNFRVGRVLDSAVKLFKWVLDDDEELEKIRTNDKCGDMLDYIALIRYKDFLLSTEVQKEFSSSINNLSISNNNNNNNSILYSNNNNNNNNNNYNNYSDSLHRDNQLPNTEESFIWNDDNMLIFNGEFPMSQVNSNYKTPIDSNTSQQRSETFIQQVNIPNIQQKYPISIHKPKERQMIKLQQMQSKEKYVVVSSAESFVGLKSNNVKDSEDKYSNSDAYKASVTFCEGYKNFTYKKRNTNKNHDYECHWNFNNHFKECNDYLRIVYIDTFNGDINKFEYVVKHIGWHVDSLGHRMDEENV